MADVAHEARPSFAALAELTHQADDHPEVRLELLREAAQVLDQPDSYTTEQLVQLADRAERWRYQLINHSVGHLSDAAQTLQRGVDLLMNDLRRQPGRRPRDLRAALAHACAGRAEAALDPAIPTSRLEAEAQRLTDQHFALAPAARSMFLYAPLYLSNHCINHCLYCGFRYPNATPRELLTTQQALDEAEVLRQRGFKHILLVAGEYPRWITVEYLGEIAAALTGRGFTVDIEVAPLSTLQYEQLRRQGVRGVTLYQETFDEPLYAHYHPKGTKSWYDWRIEGHERAAEAGIDRLGLGILLGLGDPAADYRALITHGHYLLQRFPNLRLAFSLPRIHEAPDSFQTTFPIDDELLVRLYNGLRLEFPSATLVLSTREGPALRDRLARDCITQMSAGSSTAPGGYLAQEAGHAGLEQFPVVDHRAPAEVAAWLGAEGFSVRWDLEPAPPDPLASI